MADELKGTIEDHLESILNVNADNFDGTYILSTALNPQLAVLLSDEQIAYAKKTLEKQVRGGNLKEFELEDLRGTVDLFGGETCC